MNSPPTVTDLARATLLHLSELGLPPSSENYAKFYAEISGEPITPKSAESAELVRMVQLLVDEVAKRTGSLVNDLGERNRDMRHSIDELSSVQEKTLIMQLLEALVAKADSIHETVADTHEDMEATRLALDHMSAELIETRQSLHEDSLTGAQNRRGMDTILLREVARAKRNQNRLVVAMMDVDHFKQVNDTYGHDVGDKLLVHLSMIAKSVMRESDALIRYGGEEFLLILPETDLQGASYVMDRLRQVIAKAPLIYDNKRIEVTLSAGLARLGEGENGHSLVLRADHALYEAKRAGRDRVVIASELPSANAR
ncbi:MAG: GGDEF domain-containing protein [Hydrogenophilales bacterium]|nr:GGDEF domain-containing protein [Hydrogenophilales bacterium]